MRLYFVCIVLLISIHYLSAQLYCDVGMHDHPSPAVNSIKNRSIDPVYTIPIALHIVGNESFIQSIGEELLSDQLTYVNEVFAGSNAGLKNVRKEFEAIIGIANIQFEISNVIIRETDKEFIKATLGTQDNLEEVKQSNKGGSDPLDIDSYLNIWICDVLQPNGNQNTFNSAYGTPPVGAPGWPTDLDFIQGIVIDDDFLVTNKKALVHEIGHYLGLRHIIEFFSDPCEDTDGIEDTPVVFQSTVCNFRDTCNGPGSDMEENFMNPQVLSCRSAFTRGQVDRMRYILEQFRPDLYTTSASNNHIPSSEVFIYPNVTSDSYNISFADCDFKLVTINIYSRQGIPLDTNQFTSSSIKNLSVAHLPTGLYYINIVYGDFTKTFRLVKI